MAEIDGPGTPDAESLRLEEAAVAYTVGSVTSALRDTMARILTVFESGRLAVVQLREFILRALQGITAPAFMDSRMSEAADQARALGITQAIRYAQPPGGIDGEALEWGVDRLPELDRLLTEGIAEAARLAQLAALETKTDVNVVLGRIGATAAGLEGNVRRVVNEEINRGTNEVAVALGLNLIWVPERDACLHCLAHAGWVVEPGQAFPPVSFDPEARRVWTVLYPPLHPNCRCRVRTTDAAPGRPDPDRSSVEPGAALAREARRSVVYQWSGSASGAAARRAAARLLDLGAGLPVSVERRARAALNKDKPVRRP